MTLRDVYWKVMREAGLSDDRIRVAIERVQVISPLPINKELSEQDAEKAEIMIRDLHAFATDNPDHAKATVLKYAAQVAANN